MALDHRELICLIFCDASKAFDRVRLRGLLLKLKGYGIKGWHLLSTDQDTYLDCCICRYKRNNQIIAAWETHSTGVALSNIINLATSVVRSYGRIECGRSLVQIPSRIKDYEICICCFFDKHPTLSSKSIDWFHVVLGSRSGTINNMGTKVFEIVKQKKMDSSYALILQFSQFFWSHFIDSGFSKMFARNV
jgi:hypothetical protein